jgi:hypothetical protein
MFQLLLSGIPRFYCAKPKKMRVAGESEDLKAVTSNPHQRVIGADDMIKKTG